MPRKAQTHLLYHLLQKQKVDKNRLTSSVPERLEPSLDGVNLHGDLVRVGRSGYGPNYITTNASIRFFLHQ